MCSSAVATTSSLPRQPWLPRWCAGGGTTPSAVLDRAVLDPPEAMAGSCLQDLGVLSGGTLGAYRVLELVGSGAMGNVYSAEHRESGRRVAIKTVRTDEAYHCASTARLLTEGHISALIDHPNCVQAFDITCEPDGMGWFAMELLEGSTLAALCDENALSLERCFDLAAQTCRALAATHRTGVVHRDIKPGNLFVVEQEGRDVVKLFDFGIACPTGDGPARGEPAHDLVLGTPPYMAPEQLSGDALDARCDLYAMGALLFELLSGHVPFERPSTAELFNAVQYVEPPAPSAHVTLPLCIRFLVDDTITRCLAKRPADRPASAQELAAELSEISRRLRDEPDRVRQAPPRGAAVPPTSNDTPHRFARSGH